METNSRTASLRSKIPIVGPGPRGAGQLYYTSRVLNSTARYDEFVKKLRASEKELKRLEEEALKKAEDKHKISFFSRCQHRLKDLYAIEEKENVRKLVQQVYDGKTAAWQDTKDRLAHLLAKHKKEHENSSTEFSLSKCIHALPLIRKQQTQETVEAWGHQVQEKQARKMADAEVENMWQAVLMKETEMLTARMEFEAIDRYRRDLKAKEDTDRLVEIRRIERAKQQEMLKRETLLTLAKFEKNRVQEKEEKRQHEKIRRQRVEDINEMIKERLERRIMKHLGWLRREIAECNLKLSEQKHRFAKQKDDNIPLILEEYERREDAAYVKRNQMSELSRKIELERARQEAEEQLRKCQIATKEYQEQIMLCRPKYSHSHPFMKQARPRPSMRTQL